MKNSNPLLLFLVFTFGASLVFSSWAVAEASDPSLSLAVQPHVSGQATGTEVLGDYQCGTPPANNWLIGTISMKANSPTLMQWTNLAGVKWNLIPDFANQRLLTDSTCPYPGKNFNLTMVNGRVTGFNFNGSTFSKTTPQTPAAPAGLPVLTFSNGTLGNNYKVEYSNNLSSWQTLASVALDGDSFTWIDHQSTLTGAKFYRAKPWVLQAMSAPVVAPIEPRVFTQNEVMGVYERLPVENGWHTVTIALKPTTTILKWTNAAGSEWDLIPDLNNQKLLTNGTSPYPGQNVTIEQVAGELSGIYFSGEFYKRVGSSAPTITDSLMTGYMHSYFTSAIPANNAYGFTFYTAIWSLLDKPLQGYQVGLPGTWLMPNNNDFTEPMLPPDNPMRISSPDRSPWRDLFQTIEGSAGAWVSTQFPVAQPKYRMNGTFNGYINEVSSPGWGFGNPTALPSNAMGLAQLSNRLIVPPDGLTFNGSTSGEFLGYGWMALPIVPATATVGDQSWTCFINSTNFKGAVAFYVPQLWTRYSEVYPTVTGRGLDTLPGLVPPMTMEFGRVPMAMQTSSNGSVYARVPRLLFPTDGNKSYLSTDITLYTKDAIFNSVQNWFNGGAVNTGKFTNLGKFIPSISTNPIGFSGGPSRIAMNGFSNTVQSAALDTPGGGQAFGLQWTGATTPGIFPEYFVVNGSAMNAIAEDDLPADVLLPGYQFRDAPVGTNYTSPTSWNSPAPSSAIMELTLNDGTIISYAWYRFVDQPAVQGFAWTTEQKNLIQSRIELIHANWSTSASFMPSPTGGVLATLDPALLLTPPVGLEVGYVPIVIEQRKP